jgi:hypothetical protein
MWIKIFEGANVKLNSLVKVEWRGYYPVFVVHERFEKYVKWVVWIITIIGIGISVISIHKWYYSLGLSVLIFVCGLFFQKTLFEYTTLLSHPLPQFVMDSTQWQTNGFMIPQEKHKYPNDLAYAGPSYKDKDFAIKLFTYLKTWNGESNEDKDNNIVLSFVIEPNEQYSTYIYSGMSGKNIEQQFTRDAERKKVEKYGKRQQKFVMQHIFWHTFPFKDGYFIKRFLDFQKTDGQFFLTPSVIGSNGMQVEFLFNQSILKYGYKLRNRAELTEKDVEFLFKPR